MQWKEKHKLLGEKGRKQEQEGIARGELEFAVACCVHLSGKGELAIQLIICMYDS